MQARIQKWGDTLAVRIPQAVADEIGLGQDSVVELTLVDERLMISPVTQSAEETPSVIARAGD